MTNTASSDSASLRHPLRIAAFATVSLVTALGSWLPTRADESQPGREPGLRIALTVGQLFVPANYSGTSDQVELVVQFHGSVDVSEKNFVRSKRKAVLVSVILNGLSSVYTRQFADPIIWSRLLEETRTKLVEHKIAKSPTFTRVTVSSFSAGFGAVREILKQDKAFERIDAIVVADSIYAGYGTASATRQVDPGQMSGFVKFAREAATGRKFMVVSHCELRPDGYASTAETADFLLKELGLNRVPSEETWDGDWVHLTQAHQRGFQVHGFSGETGRDHMRHLHGTWRLLQLAEAPTNPETNATSSHKAPPE